MGVQLLLITALKQGFFFFQDLLLQVGILMFMWPCVVTNFLLNQLDALISQIHFWNETVYVSDSSSVHHQEFFIVHTAMVYVILVC